MLVIGHSNIWYPGCLTKTLRFLPLKSIDIFSFSLQWNLFSSPLSFQFRPVPRHREDWLPPSRRLHTTHHDADLRVGYSAGCLVQVQQARCHQLLRVSTYRLSITKAFKRRCSRMLIMSNVIRHLESASLWLNFN